MTQRRLTLLVVLFFVALALPTSILVYQAYGQLKWEAFYQHQRLARELTLRIDGGFRDLIEREESRSISDYEFLNVSGSEGSAFLQRSPLSQFPLDVEVPGLLGYFQVDASGALRTPIVPETNASSYGIPPSELQQRKQQEGRIRGILDQNRLVGKSDVAAAPTVLGEVMAEEEIAQERVDSPSLVMELDSSSIALDDRDNLGQAGFDELTTRKLNAPAESRAPAEQVKDLKLEDSYQVAADAVPEVQRLEAKKQAEVKRSRKEKVNLPEALQEQVQSFKKGVADEDNETGDMAASAPVLNTCRRLDKN